LPEPAGGDPDGGDDARHEQIFGAAGLLSECHGWAFRRCIFAERR
jgi:hypothetical protein